MPGYFRGIADLLELKGKSIFKIRAYQEVEWVIKYLSVEAGELVAKNDLKEVLGVGKAITKKVTEMVTTMYFGYNDKLKAEFPQGVKK